MPSTQYKEYAETEFYRPGYYPMPYVIGGTINGKNIDNLRTIPSGDLSSLIRQHIFHTRAKILQEQQQNDISQVSNLLVKIFFIIKVI